MKGLSTNVPWKEFEPVDSQQDVTKRVYFQQIAVQTVKP